MKKISIAWSQRAGADLRKIRAYIAYDKPQAADRLVRQIKAKVERLSQFPKSGRIVPELSRPDVLEIIVGRYRVIYKLSSSSLVVLTVFEGHKNLP